MFWLWGWKMCLAQMSTSKAVCTSVYNPLAPAWSHFCQQNVSNYYYMAEGGGGEELRCVYHDRLNISTCMHSHYLAINDYNVPILYPWPGQIILHQCSTFPQQVATVSQQRE